MKKNVFGKKELRKGLVIGLVLGLFLATIGILSFNKVSGYASLDMCKDERTDPYHRLNLGTCAWSCGVGTIPDNDENSPTYGECICKSGLTETGIDSLDRRVCEKGCTDTCTNLGYQCGTQTVCGLVKDCGTCALSNQICREGKCEDR